jgi:hypothetical protein
MSFVVGPFERLGSRGVKATMNRLRVMLVWLLPAVCVAAAEQSVLEPVGGCSVGCSRSSLSASRQGEHPRLPDARSFEQSARLVGRRIGTQSGPSGCPVALPGSEVAPVALGQVYLCAFFSHESLALAQCWQFRWRTALEPRAPSSVS